MDNSAQSILLDSVFAKDEKSRLSINFSNYYKFKKATLFLKHVDAKYFDFDYSMFHFQPYTVIEYDNNANDWNSDITATYNGIIESQKRLNNLQGIKAASIELAQFNDSQLFLGRGIIALKTWWNDYGFNKTKVIMASSEIFLGFLIINCFIFRWLFIVYPLFEIKEARERSFKFKNKIYGLIYRFILCALYSGIIFYGLKFDVSNLKVKNIGLVTLLILEYIVGIVSLAYIANLIITK